MPVVALDANALMMPVELEVRVFDELDRLLDGHELVTPRAVLDELDRLSAGAGKAATAATVGHDLAEERCRVVEAEDATNADDALVELAQTGAVDYVVTNDGPLADRIRAAGVPVIAVRGPNTLAVSPA